MLSLAVFGPTDGWEGFAGLMAGTAVAALAHRFLFGAQRDRTDGETGHAGIAPYAAGARWRAYQVE